MQDARIGRFPIHNAKRSASRTFGRIRDIFLSSFPVTGALMLWEVCAFISGSRFVPHLATLGIVVVESIWNDPIIAAQGGGTSGYGPHVIATLEMFLLCVCTGAAGGFVTSVVCFPWISLRGFLSAVLRPWHVIPPLIVIPLAYALLGPSQLTSCLGGAFYAFVSTGIIVSAALDQVPNNLIDLARLAGAGPLRIAWRVRAVSILPVLVGPFKIVGSFTLGVVVILEYLAAPVGIGRVMKFAIAYNSVELILAGVFWAALIGYCFSAGIDLVSNIFLRWASKTRAGNARFKLIEVLRLASK